MTKNQKEMLERYAREMKSVSDSMGHDVEGGHSDADAILCELLERLGFGEVVELYNSIEKWYS